MKYVFLQLEADVFVTSDPGFRAAAEDTAI